MVRTVHTEDLLKGALLSILVKTSKAAPCRQLLSDLELQITALGSPPVEVLVREESGRADVSADLSSLMREAVGHYVVFFVEGDEIAPDYLKTVLDAVTRNPYADCIGMKGLWSIGFGVPRPVTYSVRNQGDYESGGAYLKPPGSSIPIRRDIATRYEFRENPLGTERDWALRLLGDMAVVKETFLDRVLHHHWETGIGFDVSGHEALKISCILTSYNRPTFLRQALKSLQDQMHKNWELLVFDDSSQMDVVPILRDFDLPVTHVVKTKVTPKERGSVNRLSVNINKGLALATGDLICFLADDDYYFPGWFEEAASFFVSHPKVNVGYGRLVYSRSRQMEFRGIAESRFPGGVLVNPFEQVDHNQVMHRRFKVPYLWPESFSTVGNPDAHYYKEIAKAHPFHPIGANAAVKRIHSKNIQKNIKDLTSCNAEGFRE